MRIESLEVRTLDGLNGPLEAGGFVAGVNVVVGPNASGKSSLVRAVRAVLYPDDGDLVDVRLSLVTDDGTRLLAHRLGRDIRWLRAGQETARPPLPAEEVVGAYVLELEDLVADGGKARRRGAVPVDEHIAGRLQLELTGGVDMPALWRPLRASLKGGRKAKAELARAERALAGLRRERLRLAEQEQRLGQDEAARAALARTAARGASVSTARALADALDDMAAADERLRELPPELAELRPSDPEDVAKVAAELSDALAEVEEKGRRLRDAERVARDDRLPSTLTLAEAKERSALAEELRRWEEDAASLAAEVDGAKAALDQAWRAMGGVPGHAGAAGIDRATIDGAAAAAFELQAADLEEDHLARRLREVEAAGEDESPEAEDVDALRRAAHELARWLELPPPVGRLPGWGWALSLGLAAGAVAAAFLLPRPWPEASAALMLAWLLAAFAVSRRPRAPARDAAEPALRRALGAAGLELPPAATHEAAAELLAVVVDSVSREERRREEREERAARFAQLQDDLAAARRRRQAAVQRLAALRDEHGFGARGDAGFVQWLALAREHALLLVRLSDLEGRLERRTARCARARRDLLAYLSGAGEVVPEDVVAAVLVERCRRLCDAVADRDAAAERARTLAQEIARARAEAAGAARRLEAIAARLGYRPEGRAPAAAAPDDPPAAWPPEEVEGLRRHVARLARLLPRYEEAQRQRAEAAATANHCRRSLEHDAELLAAAEARDRAAIASVAEEAEAADVEAKKLGERIGALKEQVRKAGEERALERAAADARRARDALEAHRETRMEQAAAAFLLGHVEDEHEAVTKPAALERAREWFARVTHGDFELTFEPSEGGGWRFGAVDRRDGAGGRRLRLEELSTGTKAQLLVSARLAFALTLEDAADGEPGETLPFVLDEALTTSDPRRFAELAGAVLDVVEASGRQFVYLSARPEDAELWRRAAESRPGAPLAVIRLAGSAAAAERAVV